MRVPVLRVCRKCGENGNLANDGEMKIVGWRRGLLYEHADSCPVFELAEGLARAVQE